MPIGPGLLRDMTSLGISSPADLAVDTTQRVAAESTVVLTANTINQVIVYHQAEHQVGAAAGELLTLRCRIQIGAAVATAGTGTQLGVDFRLRTADANDVASANNVYFIELAAATVGDSSGGVVHVDAVLDAGASTLSQQRLMIQTYALIDRSNVAAGGAASAENLNEGTLAGGGSVLDQRGTVQPVRPYR